MPPSGYSRGHQAVQLSERRSHGPARHTAEKQPAPIITACVQHLMDHAAGEDVTARKRELSTFPVIEQLRPLMVTLMGSGGFAALLSRAQVLATPEVPWLHAAQVAENGTLTLPTDRPERLDLDAMLKGEAAVLVQLLGLMVAFIGEALTVRVVADAWPDAQVDEWMFRKGGQRDKTP